MARPPRRSSRPRDRARYCASRPLRTTRRCTRLPRASMTATPEQGRAGGRAARRRSAAGFSMAKNPKMVRHESAQRIRPRRSRSGSARDTAAASRPNRCRRCARPEAGVPSGKRPRRPEGMKGVGFGRDSTVLRLCGTARCPRPPPAARVTLEQRMQFMSWPMASAPSTAVISSAQRVGDGHARRSASTGRPH